MIARPSSAAARGSPRPTTATCASTGSTGLPRDGERPGDGRLPSPTSRAARWARSAYIPSRRPRWAARTSPTTWRKSPAASSSSASSRLAAKTKPRTLHSDATISPDASLAGGMTMFVKPRC
jgi:hypothetical protein